MAYKLPDGSGFFVAEIDTAAKSDPNEPEFQWNPWNKVVQSIQDGTIDHAATAIARAERGLSPWTPERAHAEACGAPVP